MRFRTLLTWILFTLLVPLVALGSDEKTEPPKSPPHGVVKAERRPFRAVFETEGVFLPIQATELNTLEGTLRCQFSEDPGEGMSP